MNGTEPRYHEPIFVLSRFQWTRWHLFYHCHHKGDIINGSQVGFFFPVSDKMSTRIYIFPLRIIKFSVSLFSSSTVPLCGRYSLSTIFIHQKKIDFLVPFQNFSLFPKLKFKQCFNCMHENRQVEHQMFASLNTLWTRNHISDEFYQEIFNIHALTDCNSAFQKSNLNRHWFKQRFR